MLVKAVHSIATAPEKRMLVEPDVRALKRCEYEEQGLKRKDIKGKICGGPIPFFC
jgi:hypothetical protein